MINKTLCYLFGRAPLGTLCFSGSVGVASVGLAGPGGQTGNGFPLPRRGYLTGLRLWDGSTGAADAAEIAFSAGDCLSVYCQAGGSTFTVKARLNGNSTGLQLENVPQNSTLYVTVEYILIRD